MTNKEVHRAAQEDVGSRIPHEWVKGPFIDIFKLGVHWCINHIWHMPYEKPETHRQVIILYDDGHAETTYNGNVDGAIRWAYITDLMPNPYITYYFTK